MKNIFLLIGITTLFSCTNQVANPADEKSAIIKTLDLWHLAAGKADYEGYFKLMSEDGVFIGTDATENWNKGEFMVWSKPYFDKGKAWNFHSLERNIYFAESGKLAWFDELLNTQMKICRGSGVMIKEGNEWKIKHYVLSMTVPNDLVDSVINIKAPVEDAMILEMEKKKK